MKRFLAVLLSLVIMVGAVPTALAAETGESAIAATEAPEGYYGSRLTDPAAIAFYQALEAMDFTSDENLSIENPAVIEKAEAYAGGSDELIRSFGAAVDSFRYDHTEFFYVDWDMLSVTVGRKSGQYMVNIGTGRTDSYRRDKNANIADQADNYTAALRSMVSDVRTKAGDGASVQELAKAANDAVCKAVTYDFCDDKDGKATEESKYIRTAYGALVNKRAVCEGYSRLYKAVLDKLGVECELISGYYIDGEAFEPHMWNYVQDEKGKWYAVDVTMNDGHRLQMGGIPTNYEKYFWQTDEVFSVDHFEDSVVSSVEYEMPYPELHKFWVTPTSSGLFESGYGSYGGKSGLWFSYDGKSADDLEAEGLYMAFRMATTNTGSVRWSDWQSAKEMARIYQEGGVVSADGKTYILMPNISMFAMECGIFDTAEDVETVINGAVVSRKYSEEAVTSHLMEKTLTENPEHDENYIAPTYIHSTEPRNLLQAWMDVAKGTQHITITYNDTLRVVEGQKFALTWGVSSYNRRDLSLESVQKQAKVENVTFDGDRTISFDFTPSKAYNHNMIEYQFTVNNLVNIKDDGTDGVPPINFGISCRYDDDIACCRIFNDGRLWVNSYAQPTLVANSDLSMEGWTYKDTDGMKKGVSESQRSQMALVVTRPHNSEELVDKTAKQIAGGADAIAGSATYEIDLNICGKIVQIPNGSYMKLNLGIPDGFTDLMGKEDITFKLYHFKRITGPDGTEILDYENPEIIDCVLTPYGLIATVNSFSPYVLVAVDNSKLPAEKQDTSRGIALLSNGHGGKVESSIPAAGTLEEDENVTYTLHPDAGYEVEFVHLNGKPLTVTDNTITLTYDQLKSSNTLEVGFVAASVKAAENSDGVDNIPPSASCTVTFHSNGGSPVAAIHVKSETVVAEPEPPTMSGYSFDGWYVDHELTRPYDFSTPIIASITLYAKWTPQIGSGSEPSQDTVVTILESNYRKAYLFGKNDGLIHPKDPLTRAEAAAILYRLLDGDVRASVSGKDAPFADTPKDAWYYDEVAALYNLDIIHGKSATVFDPNTSITRAEFVEMCANLIRKLPEDAGTVSFKDLDGHWAKASIEKAAALGWVSGVGGGKFVPGKNITRAEAVAITNRILGRSVQSVDELGKDMKTWTDNMDTTAWYYLAVQAAGNDCGAKTA